MDVLDSQEGRVVMGKRWEICSLRLCKVGQTDEQSDLEGDRVLLR